MEKIKLGLVPSPGFDSTYNRCHKYKFTPKPNRKNGHYTFFVTGPKLFFFLFFPSKGLKFGFPFATAHRCIPRHKVRKYVLK